MFERQITENIACCEQAPAFPILFQDEWYIAVHKPTGMLVHRTEHAPRGQQALLPLMRKQIGQRVYPVHRLDRKTSGVLLLALSSDAAARLSAQFAGRTVKKKYLAVIRGWMTPPDGCVDRPLSPLPGEMPRPAKTVYRTVETAERDVPVFPHNTSRYSLVEMFPETGRRQQIRRHFSGISHPIIGDKSHGDKRHNETIERDFRMDRMLLMAMEISFWHAWLEKELTIHCIPNAATQSLICNLFPNLAEDFFSVP